MVLIDELAQRRWLARSTTRIQRPVKICIGCAGRGGGVGYGWGGRRERKENRGEEEGKKKKQEMGENGAEERNSGQEAILISASRGFSF